MTCSQDDCDRPHHARGLCTMHYSRARRNTSIPIGWATAPRTKILEGDVGWMDRARCKDLDTEVSDRLFHPLRGQGSKSGKLFCSECPVRVECGTYAIQNKEWGIWGGLTDDERTAIRTSRLRVVA